MIVFLRLIGILNVAVWFGAGVFFTVGVAPALFSTETKALLQQSYPVLSGRLAMLVVSRYFLLHYWCGSIALLHQLAERFYLGKPLQRLTFGVLIGLCTLSLLGGLWLQPSVSVMYRGTCWQKQPASRLFCCTPSRLEKRSQPDPFSKHSAAAIQATPS